MNEKYLIVLLILLAALLFASASYLGSWLTKKRINLTSVENSVDKCLKYATEAATVLAPFLPAPYSVLVPSIAAKVASAVQKIEDLFNLGLVTSEARKDSATKLIIADLEAAHITVDDNVKKLISAAIDGACLVLPNHIKAEQPAPAAVQ